jgi:hypothetical protein
VSYAVSSSCCYELPPTCPLSTKENEMRTLVIKDSVDGETLVVVSLNEKRVEASKLSDMDLYKIIANDLIDYPTDACFLEEETVPED